MAFAAPFVRSRNPSPERYQSVSLLDDEEDFSINNQQDPILLDSDDEDVVAELSPAEIEEWQRNTGRAQLRPGYRYRDSVISRTGFVVRPGCTVGVADGTFFWVKLIMQDPYRNTQLLGSVVVRCQSITVNQRKHPSVRSILPPIRNELCMVSKVSANGIDQSMASIDLAEVMSLREVAYTNRDSPMHSYLKDGISAQPINDRYTAVGEEFIAEEARLCCRWSLVEHIDLASRKIVEITLCKFRDHECDTGKSDLDIVRRKAYGVPRQSTPAKFVFADVCAGAGAVSCAARLAGLDLHWALDNWPVAIQTLIANEMHLVYVQKDIAGFVTEMPNYNYRVDVLHISFPCQGHSHLNRGQNPGRDEVNNETSGTLSALIEKVKPRIVTLEQTPGILTKNRGWWFEFIISELVSCRYSVSWKVINMVQYGVPSQRRRLIIVAACPGEKLPQWPKETHGRGPHLLRPVSYNEAVANIPRGTKLHNVEEQRWKQQNRPSRACRAIDGNRPLDKILLTNGATFLVPTGSRRPTIRELMRVTQFPDDYTLCGNNQRDLTIQIGNAVPVEFMRSLFVEIQKSLRESNAEEVAFQKANTVELSDDSSGDDDQARRAVYRNSGR